MKCLIKEIKIKKELKKFQEFKKSFKFEMIELHETDDGSVFCGELCLKEGKDGAWLGETDNFVNVGYAIKGTAPKILSNLFPYKFYFKGHEFASAEAVFQSFKFKNKKAQKLVFDYSGLNANRVKGCSDYDWRQSGVVHFLGSAIKRDSKDYEDFIDEMYVAMLFNPLFVGALKNVNNKYIMHAMGCLDANETTFTRFEFEKQLNCLKEYVQKNK